MSPATLVDDYRRMAKPREVEGAVDLYLLRPLGAIVARLLSHIPVVTPTMVSVASVAAAMCGGWFCFQASSSNTTSVAAVWGALAMLLHSVLDSADGQLARLTGRQTHVGRLVDGLCDQISYFSIYFGLWFGYVWRGGEYPVLTFIIGWLAGISYGVQAALVEYQRMLFQSWACGRARVEDVRVERVAPQIAELFGASPLVKYGVSWATLYDRTQRAWQPSTARLEARVLALESNDPLAAARFSEVYARVQAPMLLRWWPMAPNLHKAIQVIAAFVPPFGDGFFAGLGGMWWVVPNLLLNLILWRLIRQQRAVDAELMVWLDGRDGQNDSGGAVTT